MMISTSTQRAFIVLMAMLSVSAIFASGARQAVMGNNIEDENNVLTNPVAVFENGTYAKDEFDSEDINNRWFLGNLRLENNWAFGVRYATQEGGFTRIFDSGSEILKPRGIGVTVGNDQFIPMAVDFYVASVEETNGSSNDELTQAFGVKLGANWKGLYLSYGLSRENIKHNTALDSYRKLEYSYHTIDMMYRLVDTDRSRLNLVGSGAFSDADEVGAVASAGLSYEVKIANTFTLTAGFACESDQIRQMKDNKDITQQKLPEMSLGIEMPVLSSKEDDFSLAARIGGQLSYVRTESALPGEVSETKTGFVADDDYGAIGLTARWHYLKLDMSLDDELDWKTTCTFDF